MSGMSGCAHDVCCLYQRLCSDVREGCIEVVGIIFVCCHANGFPIPHDFHLSVPLQIVVSIRIEYACGNEVICGTRGVKDIV